MWTEQQMQHGQRSYKSPWPLIEGRSLQKLISTPAAHHRIKPLDRKEERTDTREYPEQAVNRREESKSFNNLIIAYKMAYEKDKVEVGGEEITIKKGALKSSLGVPQSYTFTKGELQKLKKVDVGKDFTLFCKFQKSIGYLYLSTFTRFCLTQHIKDIRR
jgi:hypothetical protein